MPALSWAFTGTPFLPRWIRARPGHIRRGLHGQQAA